MTLGSTVKRTVRDTEVRVIRAGAGGVVDCGDAGYLDADGYGFLNGSADDVTGVPSIERGKAIACRPVSARPVEEALRTRFAD